MIVDAHQHFWNPGRGDYDWMPKDNAVLNRVYRPSDLMGSLRQNGVEATVLMQAAASVVETEYMLGLADATEFVRGVVGWVDFEKPADRAVLTRLTGHSKFKGVRPMIQDIADDGWMLRQDVQWGFGALCDLDLTFDALGFPQHLANFLTIVKRYPGMRVVVDHCMKPRIREQSAAGFRFGAEGMTRLAEAGAYVKFSGLITEAAADWTVADLRPYVEHVISAFGADRVMWGSDWPVCRRRAEYEGWRAAALELTSGLSEGEKARIYGGTAMEFYRL